MPDLHALAGLFRQFRQPVVVLDLETTGGSADHDRITEIAFLHFANGHITPFTQLVNPGIPISPFIERLTGISNEMAAGAPPFASLLPQVLPLLRGSLIIAHNSRFDYPFLCREFARAGTPFAASALCSVQLSRKLYPEHSRHSLDALIERHGIAVENRHRAMGDVLALAQFLQTALHERGAQAWLEQARRLALPALPPEDLAGTLLQTLHALPDSHGVSLWFDQSGRPTELHVHQQAFRETAALLHRHRPGRIEFTPAAGPLHAQAERIRLMRQHGLPPAEPAKRHTVRIRPDPVSGCLSAHVRPLSAGLSDTPPHGLFLHPQSAKRALSQWARQHRLCPSLLGILPDTLRHGEACPVALSGRCDSTCAGHNAAAHNERVLAALGSLPVCDWWPVPRVRIRETDPFSGTRYECLCDSGTLFVPGQGWYSDAALSDTLKQYYRSHRRLGGEDTAAVSPG